MNRVRNETPNFKLYLSVAVFFWALFALTNSGVDRSEGNYHYLVAEQIVRHGRLGLDSVPPDSVFTLARNGQYYGSHEIGNALFLIPTAFLNEMLVRFAPLVGRKVAAFEAYNILNLPAFILSFQPGVYSAITATTFFAILRTRFRLPILQSFLATFCLAVTTYFWTYSRSLFDGVLCGTLLTLSLFFLLRYGQRSSNLHLITAFVFLGFALITRISTIFVISASLVYLWNISPSPQQAFRRIAIALSTLLPFVIWQGWYNHLRTGSAFISPVQTAKYAANNALDGNLLVGIVGYLLSPGKSIFIYAPLLVLSLFFFKKFYQNYKAEAIYVAMIFVFWLLLHARMRSWYGAWGWGPRLFVTILPILFLPFAVNMDRVLRKKYLRISAIALGGFGFCLALSSVLSEFLIRIDYAIQENRFADQEFVWSLWNNQAVDMLRAGWNNVQRLVTFSIHSPLPTQAKIFPESLNIAANTANSWILHADKLPSIVRGGAAIVLLSSMAFALNCILKNVLEDNHFLASNHSSNSEVQ